MTRARRSAAAIGVSVSLHAAAWFQASRAAVPDLPKPEPELELRWVSLPPPPPEPEPEPEPAPKPPPPPPRAVEKAPPPKAPEPPDPPRVEPSASETPPEPASEPPQPAPPVLAPLVTNEATNLDAPLFAARPLGGPIEASSRFSNAPASRGAAGPSATPRPAGPRVVPLRDLSRRPRPPALDDELRRHYPPELRRQGIEGVAEVSIILSARGRVTRVDVLTESAPGFARACRQTLLDAEWSEPLDREGNPVATRLVYRCRFRVQGR